MEGRLLVCGRAAIGGSVPGGEQVIKSHRVACPGRAGAAAPGATAGSVCPLKVRPL